MSLGRVVGMVSRRDVIALLARMDVLIEAEVDESLRLAGVECTVEVNDGVVQLHNADDPKSLRIAQVIAARVPGVVGDLDGKSGVTAAALWGVDDLASSDVLLVDGTVGVVRRLTSGDRDGVAQLHEGLSPENVRLRFFSVSRARRTATSNTSWRRARPEPCWHSGCGGTTA